MMTTSAEFDLDHEFLTRPGQRLPVPGTVAVVGAGRWAKVVCNVLAGFVPAIPRIVLVAERNYAATEQWLNEQRDAGRSGYERIVVSRSLQQALEREPVEAAVVTRMASQHYDATRELLLAGKHVLVEKPFVLDPQQAHELVDLARSRGLRLAVGYEFMFARTLHHFRQLMAQHLAAVTEVRFVWEDPANAVKWGLRKEPDLSANIVTDLYPHILSQLSTLFGAHEIVLQDLTSGDACSQADIRLRYGTVLVEASLDKSARDRRRRIDVRSPDGRVLSLDYGDEPGRIELDGRELPPDPLGASFPGSLAAEIAYFFAHIERADVTIPNTAEQTVHFVEATDAVNAALVAKQVDLVKPWLWREPPATMPEDVARVLRHQLVDPFLRYGLIDNPKDVTAIDAWAQRAFRIMHGFSRNPWTTQERVQSDEHLDRDHLIRLNLALQASEVVQKLIVSHGTARQYWSTILPLLETGSIDAVLQDRYQFPLRLGIYAAVWCMFSCSFCGRMENPDARYSYDDVPTGNDVFDQVFAAMPPGVSTLSLGGGLEPLTNPQLDPVIRSAKRHGHKVPLVTNGFMLTPVYVKRHEGLWDVDVLRISLYGVDEPSYCRVTRKAGAFDIVKKNVIAFLQERARRGGGPRVGFNFIVLVNTTGDVLRLIDLIAEINAQVDGPGIDFLTLREDFSMREGEGLSLDERRALVDIFSEFNLRRRLVCPTVSVDFGYALYPLSQGVMWKGLDMVQHDGMLPRAYPQVSVAMDLLGDVYLYRDAVFPNRPGADRYKIGTLSKSRSLESVVRDFIESGREIEPRPNDTWLMDAFDHVVTNVIWQATADNRAGIPFRLGPVRRRAYDGSQPRELAGRPVAVNYWQGLFGV